MTHRFPIKEIALQAGLSTATVDRALNARAHVSSQTRRRIADALAELEAQESQLDARGRRLFVDVVIEAPERFTRMIRAVTAHVLPTLGPAVLRPRYSMRDVMDEAETLAILDRIARRGSRGVLVKLRDSGPIRDALAGLGARGIPVVAIFTDIAAPARLAFAGPENARAGDTAAWLVARMLHGTGAVLVSQCQPSFLGEEARRRAFLNGLARLRPELSCVEAVGGTMTGLSIEEAVTQAARAEPAIRAVYSIGGCNVAVLDALEREGIRPDLYIAHDLDEENRRLLAQNWIDIVLHHDIAEDLRAAFLHLLAYHRLVPPLPELAPSEAQILTPANLPPANRPAGA